MDGYMKVPSSVRCRASLTQLASSSTLGLPIVWSIISVANVFEYNGSLADAVAAMSRHCLNGVIRHTEIKQAGREPHPNPERARCCVLPLT